MLNLLKPSKSSAKDHKSKDAKQRDELPPSYEATDSPKPRPGSAGSSASRLNSFGSFGLAPVKSAPHKPVSRSTSSNLLAPSTSHPLVPVASRPAVDRRQSSGNSTPRNKPYVPSSEQQRHIDSLSNGSISATTSNTQTEYFDVLPSFQMFQSILRRDDSQFSENLSVRPPVYGDTANSSPTPPNGLSPVGSNSIDARIDEITERLDETGARDPSADEYVFDDDNEAHTVPPNNANVHNHNIAVTVHESGHSPLDNIDTLPKATTSPIDLQIFVTKRVPKPNSQSELETRLKEYSSGDVVNGYITITNTSDKPVNFGLFTVSLEGTIKSTDKKTNSGPLDAHKYNKILMKKFLKMYDLNASYGYAFIPSSAGVEYEAYEVDPLDGCQIGLPPERILEPNGKYKKFFTFKFPDRLLDNSCVNTLLPHVLPPPSMGLDKTCFYNRGETIQLNKVLGYGFLNMRGTPVLTKDYSFEDTSISYTIEAKFIDKVNSDSNHTVSPTEINDPNSKADYVISKSSQYFLRFLPDLEEQLRFYNQWYQFGVDTYNTIGVDGKLYQDYISKSTWKALEALNHKIEKEIDDKLDRQNLTVDQLKNKNLFHWSEEPRESPKSSTTSLDASTGHYEDKRMIGTNIATSVFGKKKKKILSSLVKIGDSRLYARVPEKVIPYASPKLLTKNNNGSMDEGLAPVSSHTPEHTHSISSVLSNDENSLRPVSSASSSNINHLYNRNTSDVIQSLDLSLVFDSNDSSVKPPQISSVEANIVLWSYNTEYPLPFELGYDFFYTSPDGAEKREEDNVVITRDNLQKLKDQVYSYIQYLKANQTQLSKESYLYLKSAKSLAVKKDTLKDYYKTLTAQSHPHLLNNESGWKASQTHGNKFKWVKDFSIPLDPINKNNVSLIPSFQSCLVGRVYCIQVVVKFKGTSGEQNEFADNVVKVDIPVLVG